MGKEIIEVNGVTRIYNQRPVVSDLSMKVEAGTIYGFLGPNGAGKTTTMRMILGLVSPTKGAITVFGEKVTWRASHLHQRMGVLGENHQVFRDMTAWEYLLYFGHLYNVQKIKEKSLKLLERLGLIQFRDLPAFYFSKGMKQKLGLARALLSDPELLILDEPTSGLDPQAMILFRQILEEYRNSGMTIILSSHILSEVEKIADEVGIIQDGKLVFEGNIADVSSVVSASEKIVIELSRMDLAIVEKIRLLTGVISVVQHNNQMTITYNSNTDLRLEISKTIQEAGGNILEMRLQRASLEESFIQLTKENIYGIRK